MGKAVRNSWKNIPMPEGKALIPFEKTFTDEEFERISFGRIPEGMDDKWFIYHEEDIVYFHRSWTGLCVYMMEVEKAGDGYAVRNAWANKDPEELKETNDEYDAGVMNWIIDFLMLDKPAKFPRPPWLDED